MNRTDFQRLADIRIEEAKALLDQARWPGAYYLAGYAVECALKACIARLTKAEDFPDKDAVARSYTHNIEQLVQVAGLKLERDAAASASRALFDNWGVVSRWTEASRYAVKAEAEAKELLAAITDPTDGVLPWIKARW